MAGTAIDVTLSQFLKVLFPDPQGIVTLVRCERGANNELWFRDINSGTIDDDQPLGTMYVCVSTCEPAQRRSRRPSRKHPVLTYIAVLDDVGTKVSLDRLPAGVRPTAAIETSPGNFQLFFRFTTPVEPGRAAALNAALVAAGLTDEGTKAAPEVRLVRVPGSLNGKPKLETFAARLTTWNPDLSYTYSELCVALGVTPADVSPRSSIVELAPGQSDAVAEWAVRHVGKPGGASGPPIRGLLPVLCPQHELHTVGIDRSNDSSTVWIPGHPHGAFKCTHGHCTGFTTRNYLDWCRKTYPNDPPPGHGELTTDLNALGSRLKTALGGVSRETSIFPLPLEESVREAILGDLVKVGSVDRYYTISGKEYLTRAGVDDHWFQRMSAAGLLDGLTPAGKPTVVAPHVWLRRQPDTMRVAKVVHRLGQPMMTEGDLNIAPAMPVRPPYDGREPGPWLELLDHLTNGDGPTADALIDWFAMMIGCWTEKPGWHVILHGGQGTGKDLLTAPARWWLGPHHTRVEVAQIGGQFQDFLTSKLCTVDEVKMTTRGSTTLHDVYTTLKAWTVRGNDTVKINSKHLRQYTALDLSGWVLTSNEMVPLPLDEDDRRFLVVAPPVKRPKKFYTDIVEWGEAGGWAQTIGWLGAQWDMMDEAERWAMRSDAPLTTAKQHLIEGSADGIPGAVKLATRGAHGVTLPELITAQDMHDSLYAGAAATLLPDAYRKQLSLPRVMLAMRQAGWVKLFDGKQAEHGSVRLRLWCRSAQRAELYEQMGAGKKIIEAYHQMKAKPAGEVFDPLGRVATLKPGSRETGD